MQQFKSFLPISFCFFSTLFLVFCSTENINTPGDEQQDDVLLPGQSVLSISQTIDGEKVTRITHVKAPNTLADNKKYPVLFCFHGAGGNSQNFINNPELNALINSGEFVGIYPNGHNSFWNLGSENTTADDVAYVDAIISKLSNYTALDFEKCYALGFSNGAGMANLLGKTTEHFRGIAALFSQQIISIGDLAPSRTLSVFQLVGEEDGLVPPEGGNSPVGTFLSEEDSASNWASYFNCNTNPEAENFNLAGTLINTFKYINCDAGHEVWRLVALETGHGFNNPQTSNNINTVVWNFLKTK